TKEATFCYYPHAYAESYQPNKDNPPYILEADVIHSVSNCWKEKVNKRTWLTSLRTIVLLLGDIFELVARNLTL
ncbi:MAG: hypothetical protein ACXVBX_08480, partial [Flavisolibacter sp.]